MTAQTRKRETWWTTSAWSGASAGSIARVCAAPTARATRPAPSRRCVRAALLLRPLHAACGACPCQDFLHTDRNPRTGPWRTCVKGMCRFLMQTLLHFRATSHNGALIEPLHKAPKLKCALYPLCIYPVQPFRLAIESCTRFMQPVPKDVRCHALGTMLLCAWQGMEWLVDYDYIAIFDADFKPDPDFLVGGCSSCCAPVHALCGHPGQSHRLCFLCLTQAIASCSMLGTLRAPDRRSMHARR